MARPRLPFFACPSSCDVADRQRSYDARVDINVHQVVERIALDIYGDDDVQKPRPSRPAQRDLDRIMAEVPEVGEALATTWMVPDRLDVVAREVGLATTGLAITAAIPPEVIEELTAAILARVLAEVGTAQRSESPYMTVEEAAAYMRATLQRVRRLRSQGVLSKHGDGGNAPRSEKRSGRVVQQAAT